jgi:hypothetical protein
MKSLNERLAEAFTRAEWDSPDTDFTSSATGLLAEALLRLPPDRRELALQVIENGSLRRTVAELQRTYHNGHTKH